jgi:hypothetical protein
VRPSRTALFLSGALLTGCVAVWTRQGDQTVRVASFLAVFGLAFGAYLLALASARGLSARALRVAIGVSVLWRVALVGGPPLLSNDVNRYVWEGRVQLRGGNPYRWTDRPSAPQWTSLRDGMWTGLNHPNYTAVYPPLFELAAAAVVWIRDGVTVMKAFLVGCELVFLATLAALLHGRGLPRERLLVAAWSPLALVEIAGSGHNEVFGLLFLALALLALDKGRPLLSVLAAALGFQAKFLPGLVAAAWARRYRVRHVLVAITLAAALVWPYRSAGPGLLMSLGKYAEHWRFNETVFAAIQAVLGSHVAAVRAGAILAAAISLLCAWRKADPVTGGFVVVVAALLLGPNLLPWYALWLLPFLVVRDEPAALLFTATVPLAYLVYPAWQSGERWYLSWPVRLLEYGPCVAVFLWSRAHAVQAPTLAFSRGPLGKRKRLT